MTASGSGWLRVVGAVLAVLGVVAIAAGALTWSLVSRALSDERVTVGQDAPALAGDRVDTPWEAWAQAQAVARQQAAATGGATYAELSTDDPRRPAVLEATLVRTALYSAVTAFGLAALSLLVGVALVLIGAVLLAGHRAGPTPTTAGRVTGGR